VRGRQRANETRSCIEADGEFFNATVRYRVAEREAVDLWRIVSRKTRFVVEEVG
jgi:hypothetical protein